MGTIISERIMEMDPVKAKIMYPDATFTMRVSYGNVKSYNPRDAVHYDYVTTMKGFWKNIFLVIMNLIFRKGN